MDTPKKQRLHEIVQRLSQLPYVGAIFLFGSYARGTARRDSDIDIAVLTTNATKEQEREVAGDYGELVEVSAFSRLPLIIQFRVLKEGRLLFLRDKKMLHRTTVNVIKRYLDFEPYLSHFARRVLSHV